MKDSIQMNNNLSIPLIGFGTWKLSEGEEAYQAVKFALETGYRHIDTAQGYGNEASVGQAVLDSNIDREDIFVTTKVTNSVRGYQETIDSIIESLRKLKMEYIDLVLIHWPNPKSQRDISKDAWKQANAETWRALEDLVDEGKIRSIGVSNFLEHHIKELYKTARIKPVINQIKIAPGCYPSELIEFCRNNEIVLEAYSPFGSGKLFENEEIASMAKKYDCTPAQLALRWVIDRECLPLPRSKTPENIQSNLKLEKIEITEDDRKILDTIEGISEATNPDESNF